jgi:hypothetical protein
MFSLVFERVWFRLMVFNATFNNISAISWLSVLLVEETVVPRGRHLTLDKHTIVNMFSLNGPIITSSLMRFCSKKSILEKQINGSIYIYYTSVTFFP